MGKTTVIPGNPYYSEGGRMPSTTGNPSGANRGNNPPSAPAGSVKSGNTAGSGTKSGSSGNVSRRK